MVPQFWNPLKEDILIFEVFGWMKLKKIEQNEKRCKNCIVFMKKFLKMGWSTEIFLKTPSKYFHGSQNSQNAQWMSFQAWQASITPLLRSLRSFCEIWIFQILDIFCGCWILTTCIFVWACFLSSITNYTSHGQVWFYIRHVSQRKVILKFCAILKVKWGNLIMIMMLYSTDHQAKNTFAMNIQISKSRNTF